MRHARALFTRGSFANVSLHTGGGPYRRAQGDVSRNGSVQGSLEQRQQVGPGAFRLRLVVDVVVLHAPAVAGAVIDLALETHAALVERTLELLDRLGRHGAVLDGEAEIRLGLDLRSERMRRIRLGR